MAGSVRRVLLIGTALIGATVAAQAFMTSTQLGNMQFAAPQYAVLDSCLRAAGLPADLEKVFFEKINYACPGNPEQMSAIQSAWDAAESAGGQCPPPGELPAAYEAAKQEFEKLIVEAWCN
ncbi:hypothetical protein FHS85_004694 [Rhodoligotrophos appendicifer]|uniref:hypothetical protein n=1 Tax=Rhodoligotrophos appendicifer TaxID=987056 RepID=UPI001185EFA8|nr:hypothetical protein [Rhodoligotrophos appendicifer]